MNGKILAILPIILTWASIMSPNLSSSMFSRESLVVPNDFPSIQKAINAAESGQKIVVKPGIYNECIVITKPLTITGEKGATLIGGKSHTVEIRANGVRFCGFVLKGDITKPWSGIYVHYSSLCVIENNTIMNHYYGIQLYDSSQITLKNNKLFGNRYNLEVWGLLLNHFIHQIDSNNFVDQKRVYYVVSKSEERIPSDAGYVALVNCSRIIVKDLILTGNGAGILVAYSDSCIISNVTAEGNIRGMRVLSSQFIDITNCFLQGNEWAGLVMESSKNCFVQNCVIQKNKRGIIVSKSSILKKASEQNVFLNNNISQNLHGIWFYSSRDNVFQCNKILDNLYGILMESSRDNLLYHNYIKNRQVQVEIKDTFSKNRWDNGYPLGGNLWSSYEGVDLKSGVFQNESGADGIGDFRYIIDKNNCDNYPLMGNVSIYNFFCEHEAFSMIIITNSSIGNINYNYTKRISFHVFGPAGTNGFCRLVIPKTLFQNFFGNRCVILVDGKEAMFGSWKDENFLCIYLVYMHTPSGIKVSLERPSSVSSFSFIFYLILLFFFFFLAFLTFHKFKSRKKG